MPSVVQIKYTRTANQDLQRLTNFLNAVAPHKIAEAMASIFSSIDVLETMPMVGVAVPNETLPNLRKLVVPFGSMGYVVLYSYSDNTVIIETIRHMRELEPSFLRN